MCLSPSPPSPPSVLRKRLLIYVHLVNEIHVVRAEIFTRTACERVANRDDGH